MKELYNSIAGSHAWNMEGMDSDFDYWVIYQAPSKSFLLGNTHRGGHETHGHFPPLSPSTKYKGETIINIPITWDRTSFEIGQHIRELMGGNINHVVALLAPSTYPFNEKEPNTDHRSIFFDHETIRQMLPGLPYGNKGPTTPEKSHTRYKIELRRIFLSNLSKNVFKSINGMTRHNINRFFIPEHKSGKPNPRYIPDTKENEPIRRKKIGQIQRLVEFGYHVLLEGKYELRPVEIHDGSNGELLILKQWQEDLQHAYNASDLPEKPDAEPFEEFLLDLRMSMLDR